MECCDKIEEKLVVESCFYKVSQIVLRIII